MDEIIPLTLSSQEANSDDFTAALSQPLNLSGRWRCKLVSLHFTTAQYGGVEPSDVLSPFVITADHVEESEVNGTQVPALGLFTPSVVKQGIKKAFYKKQSIEFSEEFHPKVVKNFVGRIRIRLLDRNLARPSYNERPAFIYGTTCKLLLIRDG